MNKWQTVDSCFFFKLRLATVGARLRRLADGTPLKEQKARVVLATMPYVGPITIDVHLAELGDWGRFGNGKAVVTFGGLAPESARGTVVVTC